MITDFIEVSDQDNKAIGPVAVNPLHIVRVRRVPTVGDSQTGVLFTILEDINKKQTRVEGSFSDVVQKLNKGGR